MAARSTGFAMVASSSVQEAHDLALIVSRPDDRLLAQRFVPDPQLNAPLDVWDRVGVWQVTADDRVLAEVPALTPVPVPRGGFVGKIMGWFD